MTTNLLDLTTVQIIFYILSVITLATAFLAIYSKNPIHSALYLVICMSSVAGHYFLLNAQFLAIVQIIVYMGAIMILFLFTIMLMNLNKETEANKNRVARVGAGVLLVAISGILITIFLSSNIFANTLYKTDGKDFQSIKTLGNVLLNQYMVPFEFVSILLLVAMIGAVLLSKKEKK